MAASLVDQAAKFKCDHLVQMQMQLTKDASTFSRCSMQQHGHILASRSDAEVCAASTRGMLSLLSSEPLLALGNLEHLETLKRVGVAAMRLPANPNLHCCTTPEHQARVRCHKYSGLVSAISSQHIHVFKRVDRTLYRGC